VSTCSKDNRAWVAWEWEWAWVACPACPAAAWAQAWEWAAWECNKDQPVAATVEAVEAPELQQPLPLYPEQIDNNNAALLTETGRWSCVVSASLM